VIVHMNTFLTIHGVVVIATVAIRRKISNNVIILAVDIYVLYTSQHVIRQKNILALSNIIYCLIRLSGVGERSVKMKMKPMFLLWLVVFSFCVKGE